MSAATPAAPLLGGSSIGLWINAPAAAPTYIGYPEPQLFALDPSQLQESLENAR